MRVRGDDPSSSGGVMEEGAYPLVRHLLRGRMIEHLTKCSWPPPLQLSQSNNCSHGPTAAPSPSSVPATAQGSSPTVTLPAPNAAPSTTRWPTSSAVPLIPRTWPRAICGRHPSRSLSSWQGSHSSATCPHCRSTSTPFLHNLYSRCRLPPPWPPAGPHHLHLTLHPHLISPVVWVSSPSSANQQ